MFSSHPLSFCASIPHLSRHDDQSESSSLLQPGVAPHAVYAGNQRPLNNTESQCVQEIDKWAKRAAPGESREIARQRMCDCIEKGAVELDLASLHLSSLPLRLPLQITTLNLKDNHLLHEPKCWPPNLERLDVSHNPLCEELKRLPASLIDLTLSYCMMTALPRTALPQLRYLDASNNLLETLPAERYPLLEICLIDNNVLSALPNRYYPTLKKFGIHGNPVQKLPVLPNSVDTIVFDAKQMALYLQDLLSRAHQVLYPDRFVPSANATKENSVQDFRQFGNMVIGLPTQLTAYGVQNIPPGLKSHNVLELKLTEQDFANANLAQIGDHLIDFNRKINKLMQRNQVLADKLPVYCQQETEQTSGSVKAALGIMRCFKTVLCCCPTQNQRQRDYQPL